MAAKFRHTMHVKDLDHPYLMPVDNATNYIYLDRILEDVVNGVPGQSGSCANAYMTLREKNRFPHPVYYVEFTYGCVYIVDEIDINLKPLHCVRYRHNNGEDVRLFDRLGKEGILASSQAEKTIILIPPPVKLGPPGKPRPSRGREPRGTMGSKGSIARMESSLQASRR